jgi:arginase family enzyme
VRALHLHLDDALVWQPALRQAAREFDLANLDARDIGPALRLWARPPAFEALRSRLRQVLVGPEAWLTFAGSGDFHHVTLPLIESAIARSGLPLTVIHFDNHPDWVRFGRGVHCGSWVSRAVQLPMVERLITIGVCSGDIERPGQSDLTPVSAGRLEIYAYRRAGGESSLELGGQCWPTIESAGEQRITQLLLQRIVTRDVYITIDKDVLRREDAVTNWDQGELSLATLDRMVRAIATQHRIVGADVLGDWSRPQYAGVVDRWLKRAEAFMDQPQGQPARAETTNEPVNQHLLHLFAEVIKP